ncbi:hypothetical protein EVAR_11147_1 [Eumeta japonica]|uniref:Uncharacterized protein n=1 Tax=Eumeta variegata TaxID=151549 RepID=A0A4C1U5J0_EUMVA|nr:hypothetical protein EVAR_11147_1 [Eumeta japonica]
MAGSASVSSFNTLGILVDGCMLLKSSREPAMLDGPVASTKSNHVRQPSTRSRAKPPMPDRDELESRFIRVLPGHIAHAIETGGQERFSSSDCELDVAMGDGLHELDRQLDKDRQTPWRAYLLGSFCLLSADADPATVAYSLVSALWVLFEPFVPVCDLDDGDDSVHGRADSASHTRKLTCSILLLRIAQNSRIDVALFCSSSTNSWPDLRAPVGSRLKADTWTDNLLHTDQRSLLIDVESRNSV